MTAKELIGLLSELPPETPVYAFDDIWGGYEPVSAVVWAANNERVYIATDQDR